MAYTAAHLAAIESAIATGEKTVSIDGRLVTFHDASDLLKRKREIESSLAASGQITKPTTQSYVQRVRN